MQAEYIPLLKLDLRHDYFSDGNCPAVRVVPTQEARAIMQRLGVRLVARDFGIELYCLKQSPPPSGTALTFLLKVTDHQFFIYTDQEQTMSTLELQPSGRPEAQLLHALTFTTGDDNTSSSHSITFVARAARWRYNIIDQQQLFSVFELQEIASGIIVASSVTAAETRELPNGAKATVLTSPQPIPLREQPQPVFQLIAKQQDGDSTQKVPLPVASASHITRDGSGGSDFFSDFYVYL